MTEADPTPSLGDILDPSDPPAPEPNEGEGEGEDKPWYADWGDEKLRKQAEARGWKDPEAIAKEWLHAQNTRRGNLDDLVKMPDTEEGINEFLTKAGRPSEKDAYSFEDFNGGDDLGELIKDHAHKNRLSTDNANGFAKDVAELLGKRQAAAQEATQLAQSESLANLKQSWGDEKFDENMGLAKQGMERFAQDAGLTKDDVNQIASGGNFDKVAKLFMRLGQSTQEHGTKGGEGETFEMAPVDKASAQQKLDRLKGDPEFIKRYNSSDPHVKKEAMAQISQLAKIIDA